MSQKKKFVFTVDVKGFSPIPPEIKSNELSVYVEILKPGKKAKSYHLGPEKLMILGSSLVLSNKSVEFSAKFKYSGVKFSDKNYVLRVKDKNKKLVWLEENVNLAPLVDDMRPIEKSLSFPIKQGPLSNTSLKLTFNSKIDTSWKQGSGSLLNRLSLFAGQKNQAQDNNMSMLQEQLKAAALAEELKGSDSVESLQKQLSEKDSEILDAKKTLADLRKQLATEIAAKTVVENEVNDLRVKVAKLQSNAGDSHHTSAQQPDKAPSTAKAPTPAVDMDDEDFIPDVVLDTDGEANEALQKEVEDLRRELEKIKAEKAAAEAQTDYVKAEVQTRANLAETTLAQAQQEVAVKDGEIKKLKGKLDEVLVNTRNHASDMKKTMDLLQRKNQELNGAQSFIVKLEEEVKGLKAEKTKLLEEAYTKRDEYAKTDAMVSQLMGEFEHTQKQIENMTNENRKKEEELILLRQKHETTESQLAAVTTSSEQQIASLKSLLEDHNKQFESISQGAGDNSKLYEQIQQQRTKNVDLESQLGQLRLSNETNKGELEKARNELKDTKQKLEAANESVQAKNKEITFLNSTIASSNAAKLDSDKNSQTMKELTSLAIKAEEAAKADLKQAQQTISKLEDELIAVRSECSNYKRDSEELSAKFKEASLELEAQTSELKTKTAELNKVAVEARQSKEAETIRDLEVQIRNEQAKMSKLQNEYNKLLLKVQHKEDKSDDALLLKASAVESITKDPVGALRHATLLIVNYFDQRMKQAGNSANIKEIGNAEHNKELLCLLNDALLESFIAIFNADFHGPFFLFTTSNYWHMFDEIETLFADNPDFEPAQKFHAMYTLVNTQYDKFIAARKQASDTSALPYAEHEFKLRSFVLVCLSEGCLYDILKYICSQAYELRRYYLASSILRTKEVADKKLLKFVLMLQRLPFKVSFDSHYQYKTKVIQDNTIAAK